MSKVVGWFAVMGAVLLAGCTETASVSARYRSEIPQADFEELDYLAGSDYGGTWTLELDEEAGSYLIESASIGRVAEGEIRVEEDLIVFTQLPAPAGTFNCFLGSERTYAKGVGSYRYELLDEGLRLSEEDESCPFRGAILDRQWTSAK